MKRLECGGFVPENQKPGKITSELLKNLIVEVAQLRREEFAEMWSDVDPDEFAGIFNPKNWKRDSKEKIDESMRETLRESFIPDLPDEDIFMRCFRFESEYISWILAETFSTKDRVLLVQLEDQ